MRYSAVTFLPLIAFACNGSQAHVLHGDRHLEEDEFVWPSAEVFDPKDRCGTEDPTDADKTEMMQAVTNFYSARRHLAQDTETIVVETYFHIIKSSTGRGATMQMVQDQVDVLNQAYAPHFFFNLTGVTETVNDDWYKLRRLSVQDLTMRATLRQGGPDAINVFVANSRGLGWAQPLMSYKLSPETDGVIILDQSMPGGTAVPYNLGMTAVHEIGHSFGILHTFEDGCSAGGMTGDSIHDTPRQADYTLGCPIGRDSCPGGGEDPIHNYMDYSDDACMNEFTEGQFKQMRAMWYTFRANPESGKNHSKFLSCTKKALDRVACNKNNEQCCGGVCQPCTN